MPQQPKQHATLAYNSTRNASLGEQIQTPNRQPAVTRQGKKHNAWGCSTTRRTEETKNADI
jgi:hypothetical protein